MYIIKKDGLYLSGYLYGGIVEYDENGEAHQVPTAIYSSNKRDAMVVEHKALAERFGGEAIAVEIREATSK